jgi:hypothetical protein
VGTCRPIMSTIIIINNNNNNNNTAKLTSCSCKRSQSHTYLWKEKKKNIICSAFMARKLQNSLSRKYCILTQLIVQIASFDKNRTLSSKSYLIHLKCRAQFL